MDSGVHSQKNEVRIVTKPRHTSSLDTDGSLSADSSDEIKTRVKRRKKHKRKSGENRRSKRNQKDSSSGGSSSSSSSSSEDSDDDDIEKKKKKSRKERNRRRDMDTDSEEEEKRRRKRKKKRRHGEDKESARKHGKRRKDGDSERSIEGSGRKKRKESKKKETRGAVTEYGKYGIVRESDMWVKRPEFSLWLQEIKKVNLEHLANAEEKSMFKDFMEDYNTATMPSKKFYNLAHYEAMKAIKAQKKGLKLVKSREMIEFNDEELRRQEMMVQRAQQKEQEVQRLRVAMKAGMAQDMTEQARLREEMQYHYRLGNVEEAAKIQKRLDPNAVP